MDTAVSRAVVVHPDVMETAPPGPSWLTGTRVALIGGFQLQVGGEPMALPYHAQRLVAFLALGEPSMRNYTAGTLWPEVGEQRALGNLRSTVWRLQRLCPAVVVASRTLLMLSPAVTVDVHDCWAMLARLSAQPSTGDVLQLAQGRYCGDLLPGWYDDWVLLERERMQHIRLHALESAAEVLLSSDRLAEALEAALVAVRSDPLRESARRLVVRIHLAAGNRVEALREYRSYRALLLTELGTEPSAQAWAELSFGDDAVTQR